MSCWLMLCWSSFNKFACVSFCFKSSCKTMGSDLCESIPFVCRVDSLLVSSNLPTTLAPSCFPRELIELVRDNCECWGGGGLILLVFLSITHVRIWHIYNLISLLMLSSWLVVRYNDLVSSKVTLLLSLPFMRVLNYYEKGYMHK
jgi:hypothetical protein